MSRRFVLTLSCPDRPGIVAAVASTLANLGGNILESQQFDDPRTGRFFMRVLLEPVAGESIEEAHLRGAIAAVAQRFEMEFDLRPADAPYRTILMVSKFGHCLNDLLFRWRSGGIAMDVAAVVSNHRDLEPLVSSYGVPFHYLPVTPATKAEAEAEGRLASEGCSHQWPEVRHGPADSTMAAWCASTPSSVSTGTTARSGSRAITSATPRRKSG